MACPRVAERRRAHRAAAGLLLAALAASPLHAEEERRFVVRGLQELELLETDGGSRLLSRNEGDPAAAGRLRLWIAAQLVNGLQAVVLGRIEGGEGTREQETEAELEQGFLRYVPEGRLRLQVDAGKIVVPFGNFSARSFADVNPLIGVPDGYDVSYPWGIALHGAISRVDCTLAAFDQPLTTERYVPEADRAWRPGLSLGVTPMIGLRLAGYATQGPYLGRDVEPMLPLGERWQDFEQGVAGLELQFSRGHLELNGDLAWARYDVPTYAEPSSGRAWYLEPKYTWSPRLFTALRVEYNDYPYIQPVSSAFWIAENAAFYDLEVGAGWRFTPALLLKGSYRFDRWQVPSDMEWFFPDGHAAALQLSYRFDVRAWFERPE